MCKQPVLAFYCSRPLIYEGPHIGFQFHEGNSEFNSEESNSDSNSNSNDGNSNSIPIPPGLSKANSNSIPIPELDLELARKSNSGAELTPTLVPSCSSYTGQTSYGRLGLGRCDYLYYCKIIN